MSLQKALCLICECPTADGVIFAVHLDKDKLKTWFLNVCGYEFAEQIKDEDTICYFCAWQAEFLWKFDGMSDEELVWWPRILDFDDAARELRKYYLAGEIEQCWIPLEKVNHPESEKEYCDEENRVMESKRNSTKTSKQKKCIYCGKMQPLNYFPRHVRRTHKNAIRCENLQCATYFYTIEEREKHNEEVHEKPRDLKIVKCDFCSKEFLGNVNFNRHVRRVHREFPVKCALKGCVSFFKTDIEMRAHLDSLHKTDNAKMIDCEYCGCKTRKKIHLEYHIARKHMTKTLKCDKCDEMFSTNYDLSKHERNVHTLKRCKICELDVSVGNFTKHIRKINCVRCKNKFLCSGLYQSHLKKCRETLFKCSKCPKSFQKPYLLLYHMKRNHKWRGLMHKALGFKCEPCKRYYKSAKLLKQHSNWMHNQARLKLCAHCPKSFYSTSHLKNHLAMKHSLLELEFECDECKQRFISKRSLCEHIKSSHIKQ